jgi:phenylalanyl-tRNA synthetase beta subunit
MRPSLLPSLKVNLKHNKGTFEQPYMVFELANTYHKDEHGPLAKEVPTLGIVWYRMSYRQIKGHLDALYTYLHLKPDYRPLQSFDNQSYGYEIPLTDVFAKASTIHTFTAIPEYTPVIEDLTFTIPGSTHIGPLMDAIKKCHQLIDHVELKDIYKQNVTFTIHYYDQQKQLATDDIVPIRKQVADNLRNDHRCNLVGKIE